MSRIVFLSDTHGLHNDIEQRFGDLPDGDILVHAGDLSNVGEIWDIENFVDWFANQPHKYKILIAGNHDFGFERNRLLATERINEYKNNSINIHYLEDSGVEIEGLKFWGSPITPTFFDWAFMCDGETRSKHWNLIPDDTDILITHGPPKNILDFSLYGYENCGCELLKDRVLEINPMIHVFGHIHNDYGYYETEKTLFINAAILNEKYRVANPPIVVDVDIKNRMTTVVNKKNGY